MPEILAAEHPSYWEYTLSFDHPLKGNPFLDGSVSGLVTDPTGATTALSGFCDSLDGRVWRLRILPLAPGEHQVALSWEVGQDQGTRTLSFTPTNPNTQGILRARGWYFEWSGSGEKFWWNSTTAYMLAGLSEDQQHRAIDRLATHGINRIRVALCPSRQADGNRWVEPNVTERVDFTFRFAPWVARNPDSVEDPQYDVTTFDLDFWANYERLLAYAQSKGIVVEVIFFVDGQEPQNYPFDRDQIGTDPDEERYYAYAVARLAAFANVEWTITNEWALFRPDEWVEIRGAHLATIDPYHHPLSVHGHGHFPFRGSSWCSHALFQVWDEHASHDWGLGLHAAQAETGTVKPQVNEEFGYEDHYPFPWGEARTAPHRSPETRARIAWELAFARVFATTGEASESGLGGWINGLADGESELLKRHHHLRTYMESWPWWESVPSPESVTGHTLCLAIPGEVYAVYSPTGGPCVLLVPEEESWTIDQLNPITGEWTRLLESGSLKRDIYSPPGYLFPWLPYGQTMAWLVRKSPFLSLR